MKKTTPSPDIAALKAHALKLYEADNRHAKELGYALLKVRAALKNYHGAFTEWWLENNLSQARVSYCMRLVSGKVAAAKQRQRSPFQGVLVKEVKKDMHDFLRFCSSPEAANLEKLSPRLCLFIGRLIRDIGIMQGFEENNVRGPWLTFSGEAMCKVLHNLLLSLFTKDYCLFPKDDDSAAVPMLPENNPVATMTA